MIKTRFAPSPTGVLHLGSVRTALFCWLYARHTDGVFVLRVEDTDRARSTPENVDAILDGMSWLGLDADEGPFYQTERFDRYAEVTDEWLTSGKAYRCYCSREELDALREQQMARGEKTRYDGRCRNRTEFPDDEPYVVRFRNPDEGDVVVNDAVRGRVTFDNRELDDLIIRRSDGTPTYNFCVVVDDADMQISHVIRGDDHLNNTPRQLNMFAALGAEPPKFAHLPMILGDDGAKLSKRHGAVDIRDYRSNGYLPDAVLNYLVRLGWSHGDQELFSRDEMIAAFDIADINQSASSFNPEKLLWINEQHIKSADPDDLAAELEPFITAVGLQVDAGPPLRSVVTAYRERAATLLEMAEAARYCFEDFEEIDPGAAKKHLRPVVLEPMRSLLGRLRELDTWTADGLHGAIDGAAGEFDLGFGKLGQPVRVAATGGGVSPPIDVTLELIGERRVLERLESAIEFIEKRANSAG